MVNSTSQLFFSKKGSLSYKLSWRTLPSSGVSPKRNFVTKLRFVLLVKCYKAPLCTPGEMVKCVLLVKRHIATNQYAQNRPCKVTMVQNTI